MMVQGFLFGSCCLLLLLFNQIHDLCREKSKEHEFCLAHQALVRRCLQISIGVTVICSVLIPGDCVGLLAVHQMICYSTFEICMYQLLHGLE